MFSKQKGTIGSIVSVLVFVGCCAAMVADFSLWWLPLCAVPLLILFNINYKGHWESDQVDEAAEHDQDAEPYSSTFLFDSLEASPSKDEVKAFEKVENENKSGVQHGTIPTRTPAQSSTTRRRDPHKIDEDI